MGTRTDDRRPLRNGGPSRLATSRPASRSCWLRTVARAPGQPPLDRVARARRWRVGVTSPGCPAHSWTGSTSRSSCCRSAAPSCSSDRQLAEPSAVVAVRVREARARAARRLADTSGPSTPRSRAACCGAASGLPFGALAPLERAMDRGQISARGADRVIRMSWTLADLAGEARPRLAEVWCRAWFVAGIGIVERAPFPGAWVVREWMRANTSVATP